MSNKVLIISNANELVRVRPERIVYVESDGNYSTMVLHDKTEQVFTLQQTVWQMEFVTLQALITERPLRQQRKDRSIAKKLAVRWRLFISLVTERNFTM